MLDAPMFAARWRWTAGVSLALPRFRGGKKVPPQIQRMRAEDLIAAVFPDQIACLENLTGDREIPDHPLVNQTIYDCLHEAMDFEGLERLLGRLEAGEVRAVCRDLTEPSPLAHEMLSAKPYAFLDDAPLEERRTQAVMARRWQGPESASDLGPLDPQAIERVRAEAWPDPVNADEMHDALLWLGFVTEAEARLDPAWANWLNALAADGRATRIAAPHATLWTSAERADEFRALWPDVRLEPEIAPPAGRRRKDLDRRRGARLHPARPAGRLRPRHGDCACRFAGPRAGGDRRRACRARSGRRNPARPLRRRASMTSNGATGGWSPASTAAPSTVCGPRSSRSRRAISSAFCSTGSMSTTTRGSKGRTRCRRRWRCWKGSRRRRGRGRRRSCRRG